MEGDTLKPPLCRVFYKTTPLLLSLAAMSLTCFTNEHLKKKKKKKNVWFYEKLWKHRSCSQEFTVGCSLKISLLDYVIEAAQPFPQSPAKQK